MARIASALVVLTWLVPVGCASDTEDVTPILERPSQGEFVCQASLEVMNLTPRAWIGFIQSHQLTAVNDALLLARAEGIIPERFGFPEQVELVVSELSVDGDLVQRASVLLNQPELVSNIVLTPHRSGYALVWREAQTVRAASFDGADQIEKIGVLPISGELGTLLLADTGEALAIAWTQTVNEHDQLWFGQFAPGGEAVGQSTLVDTAAVPYSSLAPRLIETDEGYLLGWRNDRSEGGAVYTQKLSPSGERIGQPARISTTEGPEFSIGNGAGFDSPKIALVSRPGGFLMAWTESYQVPDTWDMGSGWAMIVVAQLDAQGARIGDPVRLLAPVVDRNHVEPELLSFGQSVGLMWSEGERIYVCGGCVPDHDVNLVLIDPETLSPTSEVATLSSDGLGGGLLYRSSAALGDRLMTALRIVFHVDSQPGVGGFRCVPSE